MTGRPDESASTGHVCDAVRCAEELVSAAWLMHLKQAEQTLRAGVRACRHMRENAEASLRSALVTRDLTGIVAAQENLETARADETACKSDLRDIRALLGRELALRGLALGEWADSPGRQV